MDEYLAGVIEVPRTRVTADEIAAEDQFFSSAPRMTQRRSVLAYDIGKFLGAYQDKKILDQGTRSARSTRRRGALCASPSIKGAPRVRTSSSASGRTGRDPSSALLREKWTIKCRCRPSGAVARLAAAQPRCPEGRD